MLFIVWTWAVICDDNRQSYLVFTVGFEYFVRRQGLRDKAFTGTESMLGGGKFQILG